MIDDQLQALADSLYEFIKNKYNFNRDVKIEFKFDDANAKRILGKTGYYDPDSEVVAIFCSNRHPKDILRSLAHELIHHVQKCNGMMKTEETADATDENYILHNKKLKKLEAHAFREGNISLREWEAHMKENNEDPKIQESEDRKLTDKQLKKAKKMASSMEKKQGYSAEKAHKIAYAAVQKESTNENKQKEEVIVNDALKNSIVYNPEDRSCNNLYNNREESVFNELMKKFGIKK